MKGDFSVFGEFDESAFMEMLRDVADGCASAGAAFSTSKGDWSPKVVHRIGGGEGEGEYVERVVDFTNNGDNIFVRILGHYESYNGIEWDDSAEVVYPRQVMVNEYFSTP